MGNFLENLLTIISRIIQQFWYSAQAAYLL